MDDYPKVIHPSRGFKVTVTSAEEEALYMPPARKPEPQAFSAQKPRLPVFVPPKPTSSQERAPVQKPATKPNTKH